MPRLRPVLLLTICSLAWLAAPPLCLAAPERCLAAPERSLAAEDPLPEAPAPQVSRLIPLAAYAAGAAPGQQTPAHGASLSERILNATDPGYLEVGDKWDVTINRGEKVRPFSKSDKMKYAAIEELSPFTLFDISWSAGYEQLRDSHPKFGSDKAAFGERLGAAAFRQGTFRLLGDGVFPALLHQDPRYYRVAKGSLWYRGTRSVQQVFLAHQDDGTRAINYSLLAGEAAANTLPLSFYPEPSVKASVALSGFAFSLLDDAGLKLVREFLPDLFRAAKLVPAEQ